MEHCAAVCWGVSTGEPGGKEHHIHRSKSFELIGLPPAAPLLVEQHFDPLASEPLRRSEGVLRCFARRGSLLVARSVCETVSHVNV